MYGTKSWALQLAVDTFRDRNGVVSMTTENVLERATEFAAFAADDEVGTSGEKSDGNAQSVPATDVDFPPYAVVDAEVDALNKARAEGSKSTFLAILSEADQYRDDATLTVGEVKRRIRDLASQLQVDLS